MKFYVSAGACDQGVRYFLIESSISTKQLQDMQTRSQHAVVPYETRKINNDNQTIHRTNTCLVLVPLEELERTTQDANAIVGSRLYELYVQQEAVKRQRNLNTSDSNYSFSSTGPLAISGSSSLTISGSGPLTLSGPLPTTFSSSLPLSTPPSPFLTKSAPLPETFNQQQQDLPPRPSNPIPPESFSPQVSSASLAPPPPTFFLTPPPSSSTSSSPSVSPASPSLSESRSDRQKILPGVTPERQSSV